MNFSVKRIYLFDGQGTTNRLTSLFPYLHPHQILNLPPLVYKPPQKVYRPVSPYRQGIDVGGPGAVGVENWAVVAVGVGRDMERDEVEVFYELILSDIDE